MTTDAAFCATPPSMGVATDGIKVIRGPKGDTPYIGDNCNWWISGTDTGARADVEGLLRELVPVFTNLAVPVELWTADTTYSVLGYGYRAAVPCNGITENYFPSVEFGVSEKISGNYFDQADSYNGGVYIYCKTTPAATITIPSIFFVKKV